jgi:hypothetical protein
MDRFVSAGNIGRYRALATTAMSAEKQLEVIQSLAQEMAKFREELHIVCNVTEKNQVTKEMNCRRPISPLRHPRRSTETLTSGMISVSVPSRVLR